MFRVGIIKFQLQFQKKKKKKVSTSSHIKNKNRRTKFSYKILGYNLIQYLFIRGKF